MYISLLFMARSYPIVSICHSFLSIRWWSSGLFSTFGDRNDATVNICVQVLWRHVFISLGSMPKSGIAGLYGNSVFNLRRNCQPVVQRLKMLHNFTFLPASYEGLSMLASWHV